MAIGFITHSNRPSIDRLQDRLQQLLLEPWQRNLLALGQRHGDDVPEHRECCQPRLEPDRSRPADAPSSSGSQARRTGGARQ